MGQQILDWQEDIPDVSHSVQALQAALAEAGPVDLTEELDPMEEEEELLAENELSPGKEVKKDVDQQLHPLE